MENFGKIMTSKAIEIGCKNTVFKNSHGLDANGHLSTAYDMALISSYLYNNQTLKKIISMKTANIKINNNIKTLKNTNRLLKTNNYITGGKTGYTAGAERCLMVTAEKEKFSITTIVLGAVNTDIRFNTANNLVNKTFELYNIYNLQDKLKWNIKIPLMKSKNKYYKGKYIENLSIPLIKSELEEIIITQNITDILYAPIEKNTLIGNIKVQIGKETIINKEIYTKEKIQKMSISDYFRLIMEKTFYAFP